MLSAKLSTTMHALLRRATDRCGHRPSKNKATTPALLRRATGRFCRLPSKLDATTHAPREGGTIIICSAAATGYNSNSRSPAESDLGTMVSVRKGMRYNSRSPAESDQHGRFLLLVLWCYNSRSPAESDCHALYSYRPTGRLQLPLSCGERLNHHSAPLPYCALQLTLSCGERPQNGNCSFGKASYNSRSPAESDAYASAS